jgi:hypothetical protein
MSGPSEDAKEKYEISTSQRKLVVPKDDVVTDNEENA